MQDETAGWTGWDLTQRDWCARQAPVRGRRSLAVLAAVVALTAAPALAAAQMPSLVELSAQYVPPSDLARTTPSHVEILSYQVALHVPIRLSSATFLIPGFAYRVDDTAYAEGGARAHLVLHAPELSLMAVRLLSREWSVMARGAASFAGSYDSVDARALQYNATALVTRSWGRALSLGAGALVQRGFDQLDVYPAISLRWQPRDDVFVDVFVPAFASVRYVARDRVEIGARFELAGQNYAVPTESCAARGGAMATSCIDHVRYTVASAGLIAGVRLTSTIWLSAFAGVGVYRKTDEQNRSGDTVMDGSETLSPSAFVRTNLAWRIPGT